MDLIVVDVEADGPCPGLYSMVCFGAVCVRNMSLTFKGWTAPLPGAAWVPEALAVSGYTREQHEKFGDPSDAMLDFRAWLKQFEKPVFISDNNGFDWQFINYYMHRYVGGNPFGFSSRRIGDLWAGLQRSTRKPWKHLRKTRHDHDPVNDARGNAEAITLMAKDIHGLL